MERKQFEEKIDTQIARVAEAMKERAMRILNSGAIDLESAEDNYILPNVVLYNCLYEAMQNVPLDGKDLKAAKNLAHI